MVRLRLASACVIVGFGMSGVAFAINHGQPDSGRHPYVGAMLFMKNGDGPFICSGSAVTTRVFITAGHCADGATDVVVSFDEHPNFSDLSPVGGWITGAAMAHPLWDDYVSLETYDVGVVVLDQDVRLARYASVAPLGFLDKLQTRRGLQEVVFTPVGYGVNQFKPRFEWEGSRFTGQHQLTTLRSNYTDGYNIKLTNAPGKGTGGSGTCSGDSGGPILYGDSDMIVAVNAFAIAPYCKGNDYGYRLDIVDAQGFLDDFGVSLP